MNILDPGQWVDVTGYWHLGAVIAGTLLLVAAKLAGTQWDDWLDERVGRGSIRDDWPSPGRR